MEVAVGILLEGVCDLKEFVELNCGSFPRVLPGDAGLYVVHETFRSYITGRTSLTGRRVLPAGSHETLAVACVGCLLEPDDNDLDCFRDYAVHHWVEHMKLSVNDNEAPQSDTESLQLLVKVYSIFQSRKALSVWMKQLVFAMSSLYRVAEPMARTHDVLCEFLRVVPITTHEDATSSKDFKLDKALSWRYVTLTGDEFGHSIVSTFAGIWINTNWVSAPPRLQGCVEPYDSTVPCMQPKTPSKLSTPLN
jgi:hypothetical protein